MCLIFVLCAGQWKGGGNRVVDGSGQADFALLDRRHGHDPKNHNPTKSKTKTKKRSSLKPSGCP